MSSLFERILKTRGLSNEPERTAFLNPDYQNSHDPFLLPDMDKAVERLVAARKAQEPITIYGDYDIDGLTASAVLLDAFGSFGFERVDVFIPNRFKEGYGLTVEAVEEIAASGAKLIVTVDCGSLSTVEIERANELGVDVVVTDHHNVQEVQPPAVAVINPKRLLMEHPAAYDDYVLTSSPSVPPDALGPAATPTPVSARESRDKSRESRAAQPSGVRSGEAAGSSARLNLGRDEMATGYSGLYPFLDLPGVGVAFKLVQALQTRLEGLPLGQEKWLLDLVALGTVCDVVTLQDENRMNVFWGLKVLAQTRRPGLKALMLVAGVKPEQVTARDLGFGLGPRMNAAGRLETARYAFDMLTATEGLAALGFAQKLDEMNRARRTEQNRIFDEALLQVAQLEKDPVLVVSNQGWSHGIIGIVAAKLLEKFKKPTFVLEELPSPEVISKGSARSYGDFSAADAIRSADDIISKGGGHRLAAGVTLPTKNIAAFRKQVNQFYQQQKFNLEDQQQKLLPAADATAELGEITEDLVEQLAQLEPFGSGNEPPVIKTSHMMVVGKRSMGSDNQHIKLTLAQGDITMDFIAFSAPEHYFVDPGQQVTIWYQPEINEWRGNRSVEGRLVRLEVD